MRLAALVVIASWVAFMVGISTYGWLEQNAAVERAAAEGAATAERHIAQGIPFLRRGLDGFENIDADGLGIDPATGLPLWNTALMCGTGVNWEAYAAEIASYNARIMAAHAAGKLDGCRLGHKRRTRTELAALLATHRPTRLAKHDDTLQVANGKYRFVYERIVCGDQSESAWLEMATGDQVPEFVRLIYPMGFEYAPGPYDILIVDDDTTAVVRDARGFAWVYDLPRRVVVQVAEVGRA